MAEESVRLMARLTRVLASTEPSQPLSLRLARALSSTLELDGAAVTIGYTSPDRTTLCATDALAERLEELQDVLREGPSLDAFRNGAAVSATRPQQAMRWPTLAESLGTPHRDLYLVAVPMRPDRDVLGVISMYGRTSDRELDLPGAQLLANAVGVAILGGFERVDSTDLLWIARDRINQAAGMVVAQLRIAPDDALALLRAHAFAHGRTLGDVAEEVVGRRLDFRSTEGDAPR